MKKNRQFSLAVFVLAITVAGARAQQPAGVPVHIVVTVEAHKGKEPPVINREDVMVHEGRDRDPTGRETFGSGEHVGCNACAIVSLLHTRSMPRNRKALVRCT